MGTGIITAVMLLLTMGKFITKRLPFTKLDAFFMQVHKFSSLGLFIMIIVHGIRAFRLPVKPPMITYALGILMAVGVFFIVISHCVMHMTPKWLQVHKIISILVFVCFLLHAFIK